MDILVSTHLSLERGQKRRLRLLAADRGVSMAALVRDAVAHYLRIADGPTHEQRCAIARAAAGTLPVPAGGEARSGGWWRAWCDGETQESPHQKGEDDGEPDGHRHDMWRPDDAWPTGDGHE